MQQFSQSFYLGRFLRKSHNAFLAGAFLLALLLGLSQFDQPPANAWAPGAATVVLFTEPFSYTDGQVIDHVAADKWQGRYVPPDVSATAQGNQARLNTWRSLTTANSYLNKRDQYTHVAVDLFGASGMTYRMDLAGALGVAVGFNGVNQVTIRSDNLGFSAGVVDHEMRVSSASGKVSVDLYLRDQESQLFVTDDQGVQATPLWRNQEVFGNNHYRLTLGYGGIYDNVLIEYTDTLPAPPAPRAPLLLRRVLVEGVINQRYILPQADWMIDQGLAFNQQIRASGGVAPLTYTVSGALPAGIRITNRYTEPTENRSPIQWLAEFAGTPTVAGVFPLQVNVIDALGRQDSAPYTLTVAAAAPPTINFRDAFTGTNGRVIHDVAGSPWTGRYGATQVAAVYENNRARLKPWMTLTALTPFRNATSRVLHSSVTVFQGVGGAMKLTCGGDGFGVVVSYDGAQTVLVRSNNLGFAPQTITDTLTINPVSGAPVTLDLYLQGADHRVYVTNGGQTQATDLRHNWRLEGNCERGDYKLTLGYAGLYDNVVVADVPTMPELYNPVRIVTDAILRGYHHVPYDDQLTATSGKAPYQWTATGLPAGVTLTTAGLLTGTPTVAGQFPVRITVSDALHQSATRDFTLTIEADPEGNLLFADRFGLPDGLRLVERDGDHWASLKHTPYALTYGRPPGRPGDEGWLAIDAHEQGWLRRSFANDGVTPVAFRWRMTKGRVRIEQQDTCWGMEVEYDGIQQIALRWNDMCWPPYMVQQNFLLETLGEIPTFAIEAQGQQFALRIEDSKQVYQRGPYQATRVRTGRPLVMHISDNTPYGEGKYNSYQSGPSFFDDITVRRGVWTIATPAPLARQEALGRLLFFDPLLSGDNRRACASCHQPDKGFGDGLPKEMGLNGQPLARHTPGLANLSLQSAFFWDGRVTSLEQVALHPIQSGLEMNQALPALVAELQAIPAYQQHFAARWPEGVTAAHVGEALASYVRTLMELRTPYDWNRYRQGTLTPDEDAGLVLFTGKANCTQCHHLVPVTAVGDTTYSTPLYKALGVPANAASTQIDGDIGREAATGNPADRGKFRVPTLRNLTHSAPYMHNGIFATLEEVVNFYNSGGGADLGLPVPNQAPEVVPLQLNEIEKRQLVAFLKALSPTMPNHVAIPAAVPSGLPVGGSDPILTPGSAGISGRVVTTGSVGLAGIVVEAYQQGFNNTWAQAGSTTTTASGVYTLTDLSAGVFRVYFMDPTGAYVSRYYNNAADFATASPVTVISATVTGSVDATLAPAAPAEVAVAGSAAVWEDPQTGAVTVSAWRGSQFTVTRQAVCANGSPPSAVTLLVDGQRFAMTPDGNGAYTVALQVGEGQPLASEGLHALTVEATCANQGNQEAIGALFIQLHDPSGNILDALTGQPIAGAMVMLHKVPGWQPHNADGSNHTADATCESHYSRLAGIGWNQPAPTETGVRVDPLLQAQEFSPAVNPQITGSDGRYAWDVATGCWYVTVEAAGYAPAISPVVGVPPAVTDLHLALQPLPATPTPQPTPTPTPTPPPAPQATITIGLDAQPDSIQNFRFTGALGAFSLDDATPDDGDTVRNSRTVRKAPGVYTINQFAPTGWVLGAVTCTAAEKAQVDLSAGRLTLTAAAGDNLTCTVVIQRTATLNTRNFQDNNGDKRRQAAESWLSGWTMTVYDSSGSAVATGVTTSVGKANFPRLRPGSYTVCETLQSGWRNTLPTALHATYGQPCYPVTLQPAQTATVTFGNRPAAAVAAETAPAADLAPDESGVTLSEGGDVGFDESGYDGHKPPSDDVNQPVQDQQIFLPVVQR